jgi:hypothetical protein
VKDFLREDVLTNAAKLAAVATLAVAPNMVDSYFLSPGYREIILGKATPASLPFLFAGDLILVFVSLMVSAACGFAWSDGKKVVGFGTQAALRKDFKTVLILGLILAVTTALLLDIGFVKRFRILYPQNPLVSLTIPLRTAFYEEVICRFGILMIVFRLTGSVPTAIILSSLFNTAIGLKSAVFVGFPLGLDWLTARIVLAKMMVAVFFGYFYSKKGLMATIALRFIMELKHVILPFMPSG